MTDQTTIGEFTLAGRVERIAERGRDAVSEQGVSVDA